MLRWLRRVLPAPRRRISEPCPQPSAGRPISLAMTTGPMIKGAAVTTRGMMNGRERFGIVLVPSVRGVEGLDATMSHHL